MSHLFAGLGDDNDVTATIVFAWLMLGVAGFFNSIDQTGRVRVYLLAQIVRYQVRMNSVHEQPCT